MAAYLVRGGALGDCILGLPAMAALRDAFGRDGFVFVGPSSFGQLALMSGVCDAAVSLEGPLAANLLHAAVPSPETRRRLASVEAVVVWSYDREGQAARNLATLGIPHRLVAPPFPEPALRLHCADYLAASLAPMGVTVPLPAIPRLPFPGSPSLSSVTPTSTSPSPVTRRIALHPGSGSARKNWPLPRFVALAGRLGRQGWEVVWLLGPAEREGGLACRPPADSRVAETPDLVRLAAALASCSAYVGNDSGVTHLVAALGLPVVAVFGPSDPVQWAPRGEHVEVLSRPAPAPPHLPDASVDEVLAALERVAA